jgi:hypothetical protein
MLSGGSSASWSVTALARTLTVHVSPPAKSAAGSSVNVVGPPLTAAAWAPLLPQVIVNQLPLTLTGSLKAIEMFSLAATPLALSAGTVLATAGADSPDCGVSEKSSTASPSSADEASESTQRIQNVAPFGTESPLRVVLSTVRFAAALPSFAPTVVVVGVEKSSALASV